MKKIVLYGLAGSGKSTSASIVKEFYRLRDLRVEVVKLAQPLYELQQHFYQIAGCKIDFYDQDQPLLENIATQLRSISSTSLVDYFKYRMKEVEADVVINDDLRDPHVDYPALKQEGFIFIRVRCPEEIRIERLKMRGDKSVVINSKSTAQLDLIKPDYIVDNCTIDIQDLQKKIYTILEELQ
ncbi:hypothetical protein AR454_21770 [Bacillus mycoides]|uniref:AAA family ATPase n=1 Tax=Bacillus mycoides TaxID=1405 RepID=UPI001E573C63|nr:AAA family ATPase [Bacillus mycoides]MCD4644867.1 hypothetical protein [Bacillus mycoides]